MIVAVLDYVSHIFQKSRSSRYGDATNCNLLTTILPDFWGWEAYKLNWGQNCCIIHLVITLIEKAVNRQIVTRFDLMNGSFNKPKYDSFNDLPCHLSTINRTIQSAFIKAMIRFMILHLISVNLLKGFKLMFDSLNETGNNSMNDSVNDLMNN